MVSHPTFVFLVDVGMVSFAPSYDLLGTYLDIVKIYVLVDNQAKVIGMREEGEDIVPIMVTIGVIVVLFHSYVFALVRYQHAGIRIFFLDLRNPS